MDNSPPRWRILVCVNERLTLAKPSCGARGGKNIADLLERAVREQSLNFSVERFLCFGACNEGPNVRLAPGGPFFHYVTPEMIPEILDAIQLFAKQEDGIQ